MKKGITSEAAQRLAVFLKERRAQNYQDTEEWSPGDAVEDLLWGSGMKILQTFSNPVWVMQNAGAEALNNANSLAMDFFEERFPALLEELNALVTREGFPAPDPAVGEELKKRYAQKLDEVASELNQQMYEAFENAAANIGYEYQEALMKEFQKAASGTPGGTIP